MKHKPSPLIICFAVLIFIFGCKESNHTQLKTPTGSVWSGIPGDPNFQYSDRLAIKDVMDAYSLYWDNSDVDGFFNLFTEDAVRIDSKEGQEDVLIPMQERKTLASERLNYFKSHGLQRRHLMANTHFLQQNESTAYIKQYTLLTSTENEKVLKLLSTIVYDVWLKKVDGIWKISKYKIDLDGKLDIAISSSSNSEE